MYETIARKDRPIHDRILSFVLSLTIMLSCIVVGIPSFSLKAKAAGDDGNKGTIKFKDADIDYDSNLVANPDGTFTLSLDFSASVAQADQNVSRTVSGDGYYVAPMNGYYTIQLWGGDGGTGSDTTFNDGGKGGKGGYVYTALKLEKGDIIAYRLGGNGTQTLKTEDGGGVNGDGGNHGEYGSYYIGGGGGYSIAYLYKHGTDADKFINNFTSNGKIVPINDDNKDAYEDERMDTSKYVLVAGGGGGGGAGDRLNAQQVIDLVFNKPNGNADGGAGGSIGNTSYTTGTGTIYAGIDGSSSGKNKSYIGRGGTNVPGPAPEGRRGIIEADDPNDWNRTIFPKLEGGTGSSGNLRGGGGGAGYMGGSGGMMTSLVNSTNVGGGGGGSSYVASSTAISSVVGLDGTNLTDAEKSEIINKTNPRAKNSDGTQGGYVIINLLNEDTDDTNVQWIKSDLKFDATISKYFTITNKTAENANVSVTNNDVTISNFDLATKGSSKVTLTLKPIDGFAGGNDVNLFDDTSKAEFKVSVGSSGQGGQSIDLGDTHSYVNIPLNGFNIAGTSTNVPVNTPINVAASDLLDAANSIRTHSEYCDDFLNISAYKIDAANLEGHANITEAGVYTVSFDVASKTDGSKATVGTKAQATTYSAVSAVTQDTIIVLNGVSYNAVKELKYNTDGSYTYTLKLTTRDALSFSQVKEDAFYSGMTFDADGQYVIPIAGNYLIQAWGGKGGNGGTCEYTKWPDGHTTNGGAGVDGKYQYGFINIDANKSLSFSIGSNGTNGENKRAYTEKCNGGTGGIATYVLFDSNNILIAGGGGAGGGASYNLTGGKTGGDASTDVRAEGYNGENGQNATDYDTRASGGKSGNSLNILSTNVSSLDSASQVKVNTASSASNPSVGKVIVTPLINKVDDTTIENNIKAELNNVTLSSAALGSYFGTLNLATVNSNATVTLIDKSTSNAAIANTDYTVDTTTAKVCKTWTFTFSPSNTFLGGYDVPVFTDLLGLKYGDGNGEGKTATVPQDVKADYANVRLIAPTTVSSNYNTAAKALGVAYGTEVSENTLFSIGTDLSSYNDDFATYTVEKFSTNGSTLTANILEDESFTYRYTVGPKNATPSIATVGPVDSAKVNEATGYVKVVSYAVSTSLTNLTSDAPATVAVGSDLEFSITPASNYVLPDSITVKVGGKEIAASQYVYDKETGEVTIPKELITADVAISATGVEFEPEEYTFHLVYTYLNEDDESVTVHNEYTFESGTLFSSYANIADAMADAEDKVTESAGFEFIWDWPDGEALTTMPSQDFWLFGQLEPYTYELQVVSTFADGKDSIIDSEKVWYKSNGTIVAPTYEGYVLDSTTGSTTYDISSAFVSAHPTNGDIITNYVAFNYKVPVNEFTLVTVVDGETISSETKTVGATVTPEDKTGYDLTIDVNGTVVETLAGYSIENSDVVTLTYVPKQYTVTMWDVAENKSLGEITVEYGGYYTGLATKDGYTATWYYDEDCEKAIHVDASEFTKEEYANGTVDPDVTKVYVKWTSNSFTVNYDVNGGSLVGDTPASVTVEYADETKAYGDDKVTNAGYVIGKWNVTDSKGQNLGSINKGADISKFTTKNGEVFTLKAVWMPDTVVSAKYGDNKAYVSGAWVKDNVTITVSNGLGYGLDTVTYYYSTDGGTNWTELKDGTNAINKLTVSKEGSTTYIFKTVMNDDTSEIEFDTESITVNIDKTAPNASFYDGTVAVGKTPDAANKWWRTVINDVVTFVAELFKNNKFTVTVFTDDIVAGKDTSGVVEVKYFVEQVTGDTPSYKTVSDLQAADAWASATTVTSGMDKFTFDISKGDEESQYVAYAMVTDLVGNVTYISSTGVEFDTTKPEISVAGVDSSDATKVSDNGSAFADRILTVTDKNLDKITVVVKDKDGKQISSTTYNASSDTYTQSLANEKLTYEITAVDKAGNEAAKYTITLNPVQDFIDALDDEWVDPSNPTTEELEKAIEEIDKFVEDETGDDDTSTTDDNIDADEQEKLQDKKDELLEELIDDYIDADKITVTIPDDSDVVILPDDTSDIGQVLFDQVTTEDAEAVFNGAKVDYSINFVSTTTPDVNATAIETAKLNEIKSVVVKITRTVTPATGDPVATDVTTLESSTGSIDFGVSLGDYTKEDRVYATYNDGAVASNVTVVTTGTPYVVNITGAGLTPYSFAYASDTKVSGVVEDKDGNPVSGAVVELLDKDGNSFDPKKTVTTGEDGAYEFDNLPDGKYQIEVTYPVNPGEDAITETEEVVVSPAGTDVIVDVKSDDYNTVGDIEGTVTDKNGDPVQGATVELLDKDGNSFEPAKTTTTDSNGDYKFEGVPDGEYKIKVTPKTGDDDAVTTDVLSKLNNDVNPDSDVKLNDYDAYSDVEGVVLDKEGNPVKNAEVALLDDEGNPVTDSEGKAITTKTGDDGTYKFTDVPDGDYQISVTAPYDNANGQGTKETITIDDVKVENGKVSPDVVDNKTDEPGADGYIDATKFESFVIDDTDPVISVTPDKPSDTSKVYADRTVEVTDDNLQKVIIKKVTPATESSPSSESTTEYGPSTFVNPGEFSKKLDNDGSTYTITAIDAEGNEIVVTFILNTVDDFIEGLDDGWTDPSKPTEDELEDAISAIDKMLEDEDENLTDDEKKDLEEKRSELVGDLKNDKLAELKDAYDKAVANEKAINSPDGDDDELAKLKNAYDNAVEEIKAKTDPTSIDSLEKAAIESFTEANAESFVNTYASNESNVPYDTTTTEGGNGVNSKNADQILSGETPYGTITTDNDALKEAISKIIADDGEDNFASYDEMLETAKAVVADAKKDAEDKIQDLVDNGELTQDQADELIGGLDDAETIDDVNDIVDEAIAQEFVNKYASGSDNDPYDSDTDPVNADNADQVLSGKDEYENLKSENPDVVDKINEIISEKHDGETPYKDYDEMVDAAKNTVVSEKESAKSDLESYAEETKTKIDALVSEGGLTKEEATTLKNDVDKVLAEALDELIKDTSVDTIAEIEDIIDDAKDLMDLDIGKAAVINEIEKAYTETKNAIETFDSKDDKGYIAEARGEADDAIKAIIDTPLDKIGDLDDIEDKAIDNFIEDIAKAFVETYASGNDNDPYDKKDDPVTEENTDQILSGDDIFDNLTDRVQEKIDEIISTPSETESDSTAPDKYPTYDTYKDMVNDAKASVEDEKDDAQKAIDESVKAAEDAIDKMENLSDDEKAAAKEEIEKAAEKAKEDIEKSDTVEDIDDILDKELDDILAEAKDAAKEDIDNAAEEAKKAIDEDKNLTDEEKQAAKDKIKSDADDAKNAINEAKTSDEVANATNTGEKDILDDAKTAAKDELDKAAKDAKDAIDTLDNLTDDEKQALKDEIDKELADAKQAVDTATDASKVTDAVKAGEAEMADTVDDGKAQDFVNKYASGDDNDPYDKTDDKLDTDNIKQVISGKDVYSELPDSVKDKVDQIIKTPTGSETTYDSYSDMLLDAEKIAENLNNANDIRVDVKVEGLMEFDNVNATSKSDIRDILLKEIDEDDIDVMLAGGHVSIVMTIKEIASDELNNAAINADGLKLYKHVEITIVKTQYDANDKVIGSENITKTAEPISFVVSVSDVQKEGRVFYVYADHTGKTKAERTADGDGVVLSSTVEFETADFSVFSIAYVDDSAKEEIVNTLDESPVITMFTTFGLSALMFVVTKRKKDSILGEMN